MRTATLSAVLLVLLTPSPGACEAQRLLREVRLEGASLAADGARVVYQILHLEGWPEHEFFTRFEPRMYVQRTSADATPTDIGQGWSPRWSPTSDDIAFTWDSDLWVCQADGSARHRLVDHLAVAPDPSVASQCAWHVKDAAWSPEGKRLAVALSSCATGGIGLVKRNPDGLVVRKLIEGLGEVTSLTWSPTTESVAFREVVHDAGRRGEQFIKVYDIAKEKVAAVVQHRPLERGFLDALAYAPNGRLIAVGQAVDSLRLVLWEIRADGSYGTFLSPERLEGLGVPGQQGTTEINFASRAPRALMVSLVGHGLSDLWIVDLPADLVALHSTANRLTPGRGRGRMRRGRAVWSRLGGTR